jgi:hypothetical protein
VRDLFCDDVQWIGAIAVSFQFFMNELHVAMEVAALFLFEGQTVIEKIHQPGFAAADTTPEIEATLQLCFSALARQKSLPEASGLSAYQQTSTQIIKLQNSMALCRIGLVPQSNQFIFIVRDKRVDLARL